MNDNISDKDKKDWENFLSRDEKLPNKDLKFSKKKILKIKHIDLHGFTLEQANKTIEKFIDDCYQNSVSKIIVVTGWDIDKKLKEAHGVDFVLQKPFTLDDLKKTYSECDAAGVIFTSGIEESNFGGKQFMVKDYDHNKLIFLNGA